MLKKTEEKEALIVRILQLNVQSHEIEHIFVEGEPKLKMLPRALLAP